MGAQPHHLNRQTLVESYWQQGQQLLQQQQLQ
jgi:hypothetical protein